MGFDLGLKELKTVALYRAAAAELVGTAMFLLCVTTVAMAWSSVDEAAQNVEVGIGIGLAIASMAGAFGHVSWGHLNSAVTVGMMVGRKVSIVRGLVYIIAQMIGSIIGSALTYAFTPRAVAVGNLMGCNRLIHKDLTAGQGFGIELFFTFMLVFFVFAITDPKKKTEPYGTTLGIGVMIWVAHVCIIPYTNCSINPVRSFGPAVVIDDPKCWQHHWIFWVAPILGGIIAALAYEFVFFMDDAPKKRGCKVFQGSYSNQRYQRKCIK